MPENNNILTKEMIRLLENTGKSKSDPNGNCRETWSLHLSPGKMYISAFERGKKKNPSIEYNSEIS